jgi:phosphoribosylanthranilate isomerase
MTWVKICGITNLDDALVAVDAGADAVGFVFYEKSPRFVTAETVREIVTKLPEKLEKVGVFVHAEPEDIADISSRSGLTVAQIYPRAPVVVDEFVKQLPCRVIPALSIEMPDEGGMSGFYVSDEVRGRVLAVLIDSGNSELPGGTGERFDRKKLSQVTDQIGLKFVVAGGLNPANIREAVETMKPWGVDVASGVEASPGKKDPEKVRAFVKAVREYDARVS